MSSSKVFSNCFLFCCFITFFIPILTLPITEIVFGIKYINTGLVKKNGTPNFKHIYV